MALYENMRDTMLSYEGDLVVGKNGDLNETSGIDLISREIHKILMTGVNEWTLYQGYGADLERFGGMPNSRRTAAEIKVALERAINNDNITFPADVNVKVVPMSRDSINVFIFIEIAELVQEVGRFVFDYSNGILNNIYDKGAEEVNNITFNDKYKTNTQVDGSSINKYFARNLTLD